MNHHWTQRDYQLLAEMNELRIPLEKQAEIIGTTTQSVAQYRTQLGISRARDLCIICHIPIEQPRFGRKKEYCSAECCRLLHAAHATNARIDGREITHCEGCGSMLFPPWNTKKKWCSRACGQRGWYVSSYYGGKRDEHVAWKQRSIRRRAVVDAMTQDEFEWLYTLRVDGDAPDYWVRKLRKMLNIDSKKDLIRYARVIEAFA